MSKENEAEVCHDSSHYEKTQSNYIPNYGTNTTILQRKFNISLFKNKRDTVPQTVDRSWQQLCDKFRHPQVRVEKDGLLFSAAVFEPAYRKKENVREVSLLVLDIDHNAVFETIKTQMQVFGLAYAIYSTHSHLRQTENNPNAEPRFRVILPLACPIPAKDFPALWHCVKQKTGLPLDVSAKDASRMFYAPAIAEKDASYVFHSEDGEFLDWRKLPLASFASNDNQTRPKNANNQTTGNGHKPQNTVSFEFHEDRHAELCRLIETQAKATGRGGFEMKCPAHNGNGNSSLFYSPDSESVACLKKCDYFDILSAFGLPNDKLPKRRKEKAEKISQANQLLELSSEIEFFHTSDSEAFASFEIDGHFEHHRLSSKPFRQFLAYQFYQTQGKSPSVQAVQDALQSLSGRALFEGETRTVDIRLTSASDKIYLDLCNDEWQIVEIDKSGWQIIESKDAPIRFRRAKAMLALPTPTRNGDISKLKNFLNVDDKNLILISAWLVNCFRPDYPFPILILSGEQGTAKSTASKVLRELVDPSITPFRSSPRDERDLVIAATNSWICAFDNLSIIPNWLSDALCRISTGGGFATRTLYENDEETIFAAKRPIILNGIGDITNRSDLLDRALLVKLETIPKDKRKPEREFWTEFEQEKTSIFSALVEAVSFALSNIENISFSELPRMADFALWATAAEQALGLNADDFIKAYTQNRENAHAIVLEDSILAEVLQEFCEAGATDDGYKRDNILLKDFLAELKVKAGEKRSADKKFPKSPKGLRNTIERINPNLREIGIFITFHGRTGGNANKGASLSLEYNCKQTSQTSPTSQSPQNKAETSDVTKNGKTTNITNITNLTSNITTAKASSNNSLEAKNDVSDVGDVTLQTYSNGKTQAEYVDIEI